MTSSPFARATSACTLSLVMKRALFSIAMLRIIASISPPLASLTCSSEGRMPENLSSMVFSSAILQSCWSSFSPENPISRPLFAWALSSAITASGTIIVAPLYSPAFIIEVMRPSIRTLVSGTSIIKYYSLIPSCLWYAILFSCRGIATSRACAYCFSGVQHILFNDAQSLMGRYYAPGFIRVRAVRNLFILFFHILLW